MKVTQYMTTTPLWYKADDACEDTNHWVSLVSYWSTHAFNTANKNGFYYFADPVGCNASDHVIVRHTIQHKLTHKRYFQTIYIEPDRDIHQQLFDVLKRAIPSLNPAYVLHSFQCESCTPTDPS